MPEKLATFRCDDALWEAFKQKAKANGSNASAVLLQYVRDHGDESSDDSARRSEHLDARINAHLEKRLAPVLMELAELREEIAKFAA
ncbi:hypothetical protein NC981_19285 [Leptolyngbya sp. DQ-M1]|uniref:hypothetical protein n=1 Tax=Leptolyngbya sp. DQ-M1 TaxID=2933920 RepID=UPI003297FF9B